MDNVRKVATRMNIDTKQVGFSIRHKNGNPNEVVNFMELDPRLFGRNKAEVEKNLGEVNKTIKFKR